MTIRIVLAIWLLLGSPLTLAGQSIWLFEDQTGEQTIFDVAKNPQWFSRTDQTARGVSDSVFWVKVQLANPLGDPSESNVVFDSSRLVSVIEYEQRPAGFSQREQGTAVPLALRSDTSPLIHFHHDFHTLQSKTLYYRISGEHVINLGYQVVDHGGLVSLEKWETTFVASIFAAALTLLLLNVCATLYLRRRTWLFLCGLLGSGLLLIITSTRTYELLGFVGDQPVLEMISRALFCVSTFLFIDHIFLHHRAPLTQKLRLLFLVFGSVYITVLAPLDPSLAIKFYGGGGVIVALLGISYLILTVVKRGEVEGWLLFIGFIPMALSSVSYSLYVQGILGPYVEGVTLVSTVSFGFVLSLLLVFKLKKADRTDALLAESRYVAEKIDIAYWKLDFRSQQMSYNSTFAHRWNVPEGGSLDYGVYRSLLTPKVNELLEEHVESVVQTGKDCKFVFQSSHHGMEGQWLALHLSPVIDADDQITGLVAATTNVTYLKQTELALAAALAESERAKLLSEEQRFKTQLLVNRLESISGAVDMFYWNYDIKTATLVYGKRFAEMYGLKSGGSISWQEFGKMVSTEARMLIGQMIMEVIKTGQECRRIYHGQVASAAGQTSQFICIPDQSSSVINSVTFVSMDITELMRSKEKSERVAADLQTANDALQTLQRKRDQLFGMVAHELRTPVAAITMMVNESSDSEFVDRKLDILRSSRDLLNTIDDMRMLVNPDLKRPIRDEPFTVEDINDQISTSVASIVSATGMQYLQYTALPVRFRTHSFTSDSYRVRHAVSNLIKNACLHSEGTRVSLISRIHQDGLGNEYLQWVVLDDGVGIPESVADRLFDAGERGDSAADGSGYGLYIAKNWIEELGGAVHYRLRTGVNSGSEFRVSIPLVRPVAEVLKDPCKEDACVVDRKLLPLRVLLVEDEATLRMLGQKLIGRIVEQVDVADNGATALEQFDEDYDLVLTDYFMPQMNGDEMIRTLRENGFGGPIVGVTAATIGKQQEELLAAGANLVLMKPLTRDSLLDAFANLSDQGLVNIDVDKARNDV